MYGSGAGTGMEAIRVEVRVILPASPRGRPACTAAAAGAFMRLSVGQRIGTASADPSGSAILGSVWSGAHSSALRYAHSSLLRDRRKEDMILSRRDCMKIAHKFTNGNIY